MATYEMKQDQDKDKKTGLVTKIVRHRIDGLEKIPRLTQLA